MRVAIATALLALSLPALAGSSTTATGLRGHVTIGPLTPVCKVGTPCSGPAKHVTLSFRHLYRVWQVTTDGYGYYRIPLGGGTYLVRANKGVSLRPTIVTVVVGRMRIVNMAIDTGIR
jgi:hypothetical protein